MLMHKSMLVNFRYRNILSKENICCNYVVFLIDRVVKQRDQGKCTFKEKFEAIYCE